MQNESKVRYQNLCPDQLLRFQRNQLPMRDNNADFASSQIAYIANEIVFLWYHPFFL